jgi:hypothetical protein
MPTDAPTGSPPALKLSAALSTLCLVLILAMPILTALILILTPETATEGLGVAPASNGADGPSFSTWQRVIIIVVGLIPIAFVTYALLRARRCFRSFRRGEFFTAEVIGNLRAFAAGIALWVIAGWLATPLLSLLLTIFEEEKRLTVQFGLNGFMTLFFAGIVWQIADIMRRAAAIAEENAQFV